MSHRLIVEVDGATHSTPDELAHDARRERFLDSQNFKIIRFWNDQMRTSMNEVMDQIVWTLEAIEIEIGIPEKHRSAGERGSVRAE